MLSLSRTDRIGGGGPLADVQLLSEGKLEGGPSLSLAVFAVVVSLSAEADPMPFNGQQQQCFEEDLTGPGELLFSFQDDGRGPARL